MFFDEKAKIIFNHYKYILEEKIFNEYDVLGFLIFIRNYLQKGEFQYIQEFADLIAHRKRDKGLIWNAIQTTNNSHQTKGNKKIIQGYQGMTEYTWKREWIKLGQKFDILFDENSILEITICIFSLAQYSTYNYKDGSQKVSGKVVLFQRNSKEIALCTTEGKPEDLYVCFAKCELPNNMKISFPGGYIKDVVETFRENKILHLRTSKMLLL